jgi:hypothetical protein
MVFQPLLMGVAIDRILHFSLDFRVEQVYKEITLRLRRSRVSLMSGRIDQ